MAAAPSSIAPPAGVRIAMLAHSYYEEDPRVRREAEALAAAGQGGGVLAPRPPGGRQRGPRLGVCRRDSLSFLSLSTFALSRSHLRRPYALVQVHTLPDFLVF